MPRAPEADPSARVVLVAVDTSPQSLAAIETAAKVAACLKAELRGMYVEDIDLVRTAEFPFACTIASSGESHRLTPDALDRQLRRQAEVARRAVAAAGARARVSWSFSVVRGAVRREIARAAAAVQIVTVGMAGWSVARGGRLGSVTRTLLDEGPASLLIVERDGLDGTLGVVYDGTPAAERALTLAAALAGTGKVLVFFTAGAADLQASVARRFRTEAIDARFETVAASGLLPLSHAVQRSDARTILVPASILSADPQGSAMLLAQRNRSVFVVR